MPNPRSTLPPSLPPRGLSHAQAAEYCGVVVETFDKHVRPHVPPVEIGAKLLWDRKALDRWLDGQSGLDDAFQPLEHWLERLGGHDRAR